MNKTSGARAHFGIYECTRTTLNLFLARWQFFVAVSLGVSAFYAVIQASFEGLAFSATASPADFGLPIAAFILLLAFMAIATAVELAVYVMAAYDVKAGNRPDLADYARAIRLNFGPLIWCLAAVAGLVTIGFLFLVIPGVWLSCVFAVVIPAVIVDRARYGSLARSRFLTKGYRWQILGLGILVGLIVSLLQISLAVIAVLVASNTVASFLVSVLASAANGLIGIVAAVGHMRLKELNGAPPRVPA